MELMKNLEYMKNKDVLISTLFDPKFMMIDRDLDEKVIFDCSFWLNTVASKLDKSAHKKSSARDVANIFAVFRQHYPNLYLVLANKYSTEVPGFIHIKWNDDLRSMVKYLNENINFAADKILNVGDCDAVPARCTKLVEAEVRSGPGIRFGGTGGRLPVTRPAVGDGFPAKRTPAAKKPGRCTACARPSSPSVFLPPC